MGAGDDRARAASPPLAKLTKSADADGSTVEAQAGRLGLRQAFFNEFEQFRSRCEPSIKDGPDGPIREPTTFVRPARSTTAPDQTTISAQPTSAVNRRGRDRQNLMRRPAVGAMFCWAW
jgi:hypothetical protein